MTNIINTNTYRINEIRKKTDGKFCPLDIMLTGVTGAGKSTTINTLFHKGMAKEGNGPSPETMDINLYRLNKGLRIWDTPGLGDGVEQDKRHSKKIIDLLNKVYLAKDNDYYGYIDLVLVIIEGSGRDMGTVNKLLNEIIIPTFPRDRILVAINQADMVMKGAHWDRNRNQPDNVLKEFLDNKATSIQNRIYEATNVFIKRPIYFSARYDYNMDKLLDLIIDSIPDRKRRIEFD